MAPREIKPKLDSSVETYYSHSIGKKPKDVHVPQVVTPGLTAAQMNQVIEENKARVTIVRGSAKSKLNPPQG